MCLRKQSSLWHVAALSIPVLHILYLLYIPAPIIFYYLPLFEAILCVGRSCKYCFSPKYTMPVIATRTLKRRVTPWTGSLVSPNRRNHHYIADERPTATGSEPLSYFNPVENVIACSGGWFLNFPLRRRGRDPLMLIRMSQSPAIPEHTHRSNCHCTWRLIKYGRLTCHKNCVGKRT